MVGDKEAQVELDPTVELFFLSPKGHKVDSDERAMGEKFESDEGIVANIKTTSPVSLPILHVRERN